MRKKADCLQEVRTVKKIRTMFFCQECGQQSPKWLGKCPSCGEWNRFVEEEIREVDAAHPAVGLERQAAQHLEVIDRQAVRGHQGGVEGAGPRRVRPAQAYPRLDDALLLRR